MTLSFSTQLNGKPTCFVEKIISGLHGLDSFKGFNLSEKYNHDLDLIEECHPKIHTIRKDSNNRWKAGNLIHFVINNRTKKRFQFAECVPVVSVQDIWIHPSDKTIDVWEKDSKEASDSFRDGYWKKLTETQIELLSKNDGFDNIEDFWQWFNHEFGGKIIHWTDFQY